MAAPLGSFAFIVEFVGFISFSFGLPLFLQSTIINKCLYLVIFTTRLASTWFGDLLYMNTFPFPSSLFIPKGSSFQFRMTNDPDGAVLIFRERA